MKRWMSMVWGGGAFLVVGHIIYLMNPHHPATPMLQWLVGLPIGLLVFGIAGGLSLMPGLFGRISSKFRSGDSDLRPGQWRVLADEENGLPLVGWRQSAMAEVHVCGVRISDDGQLVFVYDNSSDAVPAERRQWESGVRGLAGALVKGLQGEEIGARRMEASWLALSAFEITDEARQFGHVVRSDDGKETLPPRPVLLAHFEGAPPMEISTGFFRIDGLAELHRVLTREFIERRPEHLKRLAMASREVQNAAVGERKKVV